MRQKIVKTRYADRRNSRGQLVEAVWCDLACGHHVIRLYGARRTYTHANCEWCDLERRDGVKYVWRRQLSDFSDGPDYVPDYTRPLKCRVMWRELGSLNWQIRDFDADQQAALQFYDEQRSANKSAYFKRWDESKQGWVAIRNPARQETRG